MSHLKAKSGTWLFCNDSFARVIFENHLDIIYWLAITDFSQKKLDIGFHRDIDAYEWQLNFHPNIRVLIGVNDWMKENHIIWPFTQEERFLFQLIFG